MTLYNQSITHTLEDSSNVIEIVVVVLAILLLIGFGAFLIQKVYPNCRRGTSDDTIELVSGSWKRPYAHPSSRFTINDDDDDGEGEHDEEVRPNKGGDKLDGYDSDDVDGMSLKDFYEKLRNVTKNDKVKSALSPL